MGLGSRNPAIVGSAEEVAENLISWVDETDIDGFNLSRIVTPEGLEDFVDLVVPILQERDVYKRDYRAGTLREKLFAGSPLLPPSHPAAAHRRPTVSECGASPQCPTLLSSSAIASRRAQQMRPHRVRAGAALRGRNG